MKAGGPRGLSGRCAAKFAVSRAPQASRPDPGHAIPPRPGTKVQDVQAAPPKKPGSAMMYPVKVCIYIYIYIYIF